MDEGQVVEPVAEPIPAETTAEPEKPVEKVYSQKEVDEIAAKVKKNAAYRSKKETAAYYKGLLEGKESSVKQPEPQKDKEISRDDFASYEEFMAAKTEQITKKTVRDEREKVEKESKAKQQQEAQAKAQQDFHAKLVEKYPDIDSKLDAMDDYELAPGVGNAIATSDYGPEIINYFIENPAEVAAISKMDSAEAIRKIGRLEARFDAKPPQVTASKAPTPIKPVTPSSTGELNAEPDPNKNGGKDWYEWRQKQVHKKK